MKKTNNTQQHQYSATKCFMDIRKNFTSMAVHRGYIYNNNKAVSIENEKFINLFMDFNVYQNYYFQLNWKSYIPIESTGHSYRKCMEIEKKNTLCRAKLVEIMHGLLKRNKKQIKSIKIINEMYTKDRKYLINKFI